MFGTMLNSSVNDNIRGTLFMIFAMAAFAVEDMFIKAAADHLSLGTLLILFGSGGMLIFMAMATLKGEAIYNPALFSRVQLLRSAFEIVGRLFFALAITLSPLSSASAILQATPLVVVLGGILFFNERVGWQHWLAIMAGFIGVLMIVRPGLDSFSAASIFTVISTIGFAGRDLATRAAPPTLTNFQLGIYGFLVLIICGAILQAWYAEPVNLEPLLDSTSGLQTLGAIIFGVIAYNFLTKAMRTGEISMVTPFRYTRLIFAFVLGIIVFDERPDLLTLLGGLVIAGSGIFLLWQSRKRAKSLVRSH